MMIERVMREVALESALPAVLAQQMKGYDPQLRMNRGGEWVEPKTTKGKKQLPPPRTASESAEYE